MEFKASLSDYQNKLTTGNVTPLKSSAFVSLDQRFAKDLQQNNYLLEELGEVIYSLTGDRLPYGEGKTGNDTDKANSILSRLSDNVNTLGIHNTRLEQLVNALKELI